MLYFVSVMSNSGVTGLLIYGIILSLFNTITI